MWHSKIGRKKSRQFTKLAQKKFSYSAKIQPCSNFFFATNKKTRESTSHLQAKGTQMFDMCISGNLTKTCSFLSKEKKCLKHENFSSAKPNYPNYCTSLHFFPSIHTYFAIDCKQILSWNCGETYLKCVIQWNSVKIWQVYLSSNLKTFLQRKLRVVNDDIQIKCELMFEIEFSQF